MSLKHLLLLIVMFFLLISIVNAESIYRDGGDVYLEFKTVPHLKIIKQTGFEKEMNVGFSDVSGNIYTLTICHKDYEKNKKKDGLDKYKIKKIKKGSPDSPDYDVDINLKNKQCDSVDIEFVIGDIIKIGNNSIEIAFDEDNMTFVVSPEQDECDYLKCTSEIRLINNGNTSITINSSDLQASSVADYIWITAENYITTEVDEYECNETDCYVIGKMNVTNPTISDTTDGFDMTIDAGDEKVLTLNMIFSEQNTEFKYNVSLDYLNTTYLIDPYFNTTNESFSNGEYNKTYLNESGFVQLNLTYNYGEYYSSIYDTNSTSTFNTFSWVEGTPYWAEYVPDGSTLLYCSFNGTTTCPVGDMSGESEAMIAYAEGKFDTQAVNRTSGHLKYQSANNFNKSKGTISFWFKANTDIWEDGSYHFFFSYYVDSGNSLRIFKIPADSLAFRYYANGTLTNVQTDISDDFGTEWHMFTMTWEVGGYLKAYNNGVFIAQASPVTDILGTSLYLNIGNDRSNVNWANGVIEEFIITDDIMTPAEILNLYKSGALRLNLSVRSCDDAGCTGESFTGNYDKSPKTLSLADNRYFQYKAMFQSFDQNYTPELWSVSLDYDINCTPDWVVQYGSCQTNDAMLKYYLDNNSCGITYGLPLDNGTYLSCNYCSEDIDKNYTTICYFNGTSGEKDYVWLDGNYYSCCAITNITADCSILYSPYNESGSDSCIFLTQDFEVDYDENVYFGLLGDKVYWKFNLNDTTNPYKCVSYVKTDLDKLIQLNPQHTSKTDALIQIKGSDYEDREYFETSNGIGNVYFTKENLVIDGRIYVFGVECSGNNQTLVSERGVNVFYEPVNAPTTRWFWFIENMPSIILGTILIVLIAVVITTIYIWVNKR